ncbi:hypothetical protein, conserved, partial [Eimeria acervulina]
KRSAPDQFMRRAEAVNHIKPIREEKAKEKEEETLEGIFDLAAKLKEKKKAAAEPLELQVMQLPEIEEEAATESEEEEEEDRGVYHKDVVTAPQQTNVTQPIAHPVAIEGKTEKETLKETPLEGALKEITMEETAAEQTLKEITLKETLKEITFKETPQETALEDTPKEIARECAVGDTLHFRDDSPYQREFPVNRIEWVESLSVGETTLFSIAPLAEGLSDTPLTIPPDLLGKYICVKAHRRVEDQLARTQFGAAEDGAYDQHVGGPRNIRTEPPKVYVPVVSTCIAGPVLLAEETALLILKALARGGFSCAVKLRDVLDSADRAVPLEQDPVKAAKAKHKIPATLIVDGSVLELRYLKEFITTDKDGCIRPSHIKEPTNADFATIERTLDLVSVRPSTGPKTLVVALEFKE